MNVLRLIVRELVPHPPPEERAGGEECRRWAGEEKFNACERKREGKRKKEGNPRKVSKVVPRCQEQACPPGLKGKVVRTTRTETTTTTQGDTVSQKVVTEVMLIK